MERIESKRMNYSVVVACNDRATLRSSLLRSPELEGAKQVVVKEGYASAGLAYNAGLEDASSELLVFVHQDVYLPAGWFKAMDAAIEVLGSQDPNWGVLGVFGITKAGPAAGYLYSTGLQGFVGRAFAQPTEVESLDEVALVLRRESGLRFDGNLPGFHLYGADICLEAERRGMASYAVPAFCIHNSNGIAVLPRAYLRAFLYMRRKWRKRLPVRTSCCVITTWGVPLLKNYLASIWSHVLRRRRVGKRCENTEALYGFLTGEQKAALREAECVYGKT